MASKEEWREVDGFAKMPDPQPPKRTREQIEARIAQCVKQRDHSADVLGKEALAWTYQIEINDLIDELDRLHDQPNEERK